MGEDGKFRYLKAERVKVYQMLYGRLKEKEPGLFVYLCMERPDVWRLATDREPETSEDLTGFFDRRIREFYGSSSHEMNRKGFRANDIMDIISFVIFTFNGRYVKRWISAGIILFIPVVNFLSLGYLSRSSGLTMIGGIGLPTWERKQELWREGARLAYVVILYEALPCFLFSFSFLLSSFGNVVTMFIGGIMKVLAVLAFIFCSFFLPFAFCTAVQDTDVRGAFEFERIANRRKRGADGLLGGYGLAAFCMYIAFRLHVIPYLFGFALSSILIYYVLLVATYYFTRLFGKTSLSAGKLP